MPRDSIVRRQKIKVAIAVLAVGTVFSALLARAFIYTAGVPSGR